MSVTRLRPISLARPRMDFLREVSTKIPVGDCLSLAEGEGHNAVYLAGLGHRVTAVDASAVGLKKARKLARQCGMQIETSVGDLADFKVDPENWDAVISIILSCGSRNSL